MSGAVCFTTFDCFVHLKGVSRKCAFRSRLFCGVGEGGGSKKMDILEWGLIFSI